jgi:hypothetical protein
MVHFKVSTIVLVGDMVSVQIEVGYWRFLIYGSEASNVAGRSARPFFFLLQEYQVGFLKWLEKLSATVLFF